MRREFRRLLLDKRKNAPKLINWEYESECLMNWKKKLRIQYKFEIIFFLLLWLRETLYAVGE